MVVLGLIIFGGVRRIAQVADIIVPVMAVAYVLMALWVILTNLGELPATIALIFRSALPDRTVDPLSEHAGLPVTSGTKLLASRWIREKRWTP